MVDTVADNASCGIYILSENKNDPKEDDLKEIEMTLYKNGEKLNSGYRLIILDDSSNAILW